MCHTGFENDSGILTTFLSNYSLFVFTLINIMVDTNYGVFSFGSANVAINPKLQVENLLKELSCYKHL